jgi:hypothetical protein
MKHWEFLIQKEGDRDWLSVQQPILELEEGRYRIVAHSNCTNLDVEIRVTYQSEENSQSQLHTEKYSRHINSEGLLMVLPFTDFQPGFWELSCCGDIISEFLGEFWQQRLQLTVFARQSTHDRSPSSKAAAYLQQLEQLLQQEIEPLLQAEETAANASLDEFPETLLPGRLLYETEEESVFFLSYLDEEEPAEMTSPRAREEMEVDPLTNSSAFTFAKLALQELRIILEQDTLTRARGEAIAISGRIEALTNVLSDGLESVLLGKMLYELRNPQTGKTCVALVQSLPEAILPHSFSSHLEIPEEWEVPLLIGTVILETSAGFAAIRQPFIVTTDFNKVPEEMKRPTQYAIASPESAEELYRTIDNWLAQEAKSPPLNLDLPEPSKMSKRLQHSQPNTERILPPKLSDANTTANKSPQLPFLPKPPVNQLAESVDGDRESAKDTMLEESFQALQLEERFLLRLNSLAESTETESKVALATTIHNDK